MLGEVLDRIVAHDPKQPRPEGDGAQLVARQRLHRLQEDLLRCVLGFVAVGENHAQIRVDAVEVAPVDVGEQLALAGLPAGHHPTSVGILEEVQPRLEALGEHEVVLEQPRRARQNGRGRHRDKRRSPLGHSATGEMTDAPALAGGHHAQRVLGGPRLVAPLAGRAAVAPSALRDHLDLVLACVAAHRALGFRRQVARSDAVDHLNPVPPLRWVLAMTPHGQASDSPVR